MNIEPTEDARTTKAHWLQTDLLKELASWDKLPHVVAGFPENTGIVYPTSLRSVKSIHFCSMRQKFLSPSVAKATSTVTSSLRLHVNIEDYKARQEVRDFVDEHEDDFSGFYTYTDFTIGVSFNFELLKQPTMVLSPKLRSISGQSTTYRID